ncbi:type-2 histone deacetylase 1 [Senna tora]|uniref:Type-2 histone deacetylase 1 n=1 Tax=Senna tora TaxID=362788 RepID=A0A835CEM3_9FABA|nr:type-2 histone deacetylase 1 [Senna tora]
MDSGNSTSSLQSSSGGDEEYDSRADSVSAFFNNHIFHALDPIQRSSSLHMASSEPARSQPYPADLGGGMINPSASGSGPGSRASAPNNNNNNANDVITSTTSPNYSNDNSSNFYRLLSPPLDNINNMHNNNPLFNNGVFPNSSNQQLLQNMVSISTSPLSSGVDVNDGGDGGGQAVRCVVGGGGDFSNSSERIGINGGKANYSDFHGDKGTECVVAAAAARSEGQRRPPLSIAIVDSHRRPPSEATANHRRSI